MTVKASNTNAPIWRDVTVKASLPAELANLDTLTRNLWWVWNTSAKSLFHDLDRDLWHATNENPVLMLQSMSYEKIASILADKSMMRRIADVYDEFQAYMNVEKRTDVPSVSYFSMEYGLAASLKIYSGGLGVLAGDYLKEASDSRVDMTGVGFLYRYGYFSQTLSMLLTI